MNLSGIRYRVKQAEQQQQRQQQEDRRQLKRTNPYEVDAWESAYAVYRHYSAGVSCDLEIDDQVWTMLEIKNIPILPGLNLAADRMLLMASALHSMLLNMNALHAYELIEAGKELDAQEAERFQARDGRTVEELVYEAADAGAEHLNRLVDARDGKGGQATPTELQAFALFWAWLEANQDEE